MGTRGVDWGGVLEFILIPTIVLTQNSPYKVVRALGRITAWVPMLPWTICAVSVLLLIPGAVGAVVHVVRNWWRKV